MKKIFWAITVAIILVALIFNAAHYGFGMPVEEAYILVAATFVAATFVAAFAAAFATATFVAAFAFAFATVAFAFAAAAFATAFAVATTVAATTVAAAAAFAAAAFAAALVKEEGLSFWRVLGAYLIEATIIVLILMIASSILASLLIIAAGIGVVWCVCFLPCPKFFCRCKEQKIEPHPAA